MKLHIKWAIIDVDDETDALCLIEKLENILNADHYDYKWDYEIESD